MPELKSFESFFVNLAELTFVFVENVEDHSSAKSESFDESFFVFNAVQFCLSLFDFAKATFAFSSRFSSNAETAQEILCKSL